MLKLPSASTLHRHLVRDLYAKDLELLEARQAPRHGRKLPRVRPPQALGERDLLKLEPGDARPGHVAKMDVYDAQSESDGFSGVPKRPAPAMSPKISRHACTMTFARVALFCGAGANSGKHQRWPMSRKGGRTPARKRTRGHVQQSGPA